MRKALHILILLVCTPILLSAESKGYARAFFFLNLNHINPVKYENPAHIPGRTVVFLSCPFASPVFDNPDIVKPLKGQVIEKVQLVYTTYRQDESFSQQKLNQQRLRNLERMLPDAFSSALTEWQLVGQTGAATPEEGRNYFHGFVITYRTAPSATSMKPLSPNIRTTSRTDVETTRRPAARYSGVFVGLMNRVESLCANGSSATSQPDRYRGRSSYFWPPR